MATEAAPENWERRAIEAERRLDVVVGTAARQREQLSTCTSTLRILEAREPEYRRAIQENGDRIRYLEAMLQDVLGIDDEGAFADRPPLPCPPQLVPIVNAVIREYWRAKDKHGEMTMDGRLTGNSDRDDLIRLAALGEETGEVMELFTYDKDASDFDEAGWAGALLKELVQVANVSLTWASYLWRQYGSAIPSPEEPVSGLDAELAASTLARAQTTPQPVVGAEFARNVRELRGVVMPPRPARAPDTVGRDREDRYWLLWHDEGLRCQTDERGARSALVTARAGRMVELARTDLAQYGVVSE